MEEDAQYAAFQDHDHIQDRTRMSMSLKLGRHSTESLNFVFMRISRR